MPVSVPKGTVPNGRRIQSIERFKVQHIRETFSPRRREMQMRELSTFRLYAMRAMYLLIAVGLAFQVGPGILSQPSDLDLQRSVIRSFLGAMILMSLLGVRYPVKMMPILLFELVWKALWVFNFWLRLWYGQETTAAIDETFFACMMGVVLVPLAIPWRYFFQNYLRAAGDRWRAALDSRPWQAAEK
jgi:hypothetical protein